MSVSRTSRCLFCSFRQVAKRKPVLRRDIHASPIRFQNKPKAGDDDLPQQYTQSRKLTDEEIKTNFTPAQAAPKLHADISLSMVNVNPTAAELPYVVMLDAIDFLSTTTSRETLDKTMHNSTKPKSFANLFSNSSSTSRQSSASAASTSKSSSKDPQPLPIIHTAWSFHHPNTALPAALSASTSPSNSHNARHTKITFPIPHQGTCHGLAGYFETILYPGVELSTNPLTMEEKSAGMISWFPIFFPFKNPLFLPQNGVVDVSMWRQTDDRKVWYEWMAEVYAMINSADGTSKKIKVGSTDLHSSEKEACLM